MLVGFRILNKLKKLKMMCKIVRATKFMCQYIMKSTKSHRFRFCSILVANPCNARASCEIGLLVKNNLPNLLKIYLWKINPNLIKIYLVLVLLD